MPHDALGPDVLASKSPTARRGLIHFGDNLPFLRTLPSASVDLIYIDPPFNTGRTQARSELRTERAEDGDRTGFKGARYRTVKVGVARSPTRSTTTSRSSSRASTRLIALLKPTGNLYFHIDYREVHYCKVLLDAIFGREQLLERDHLGLRLRRAHDEDVARQARQHPLVRARTRAHTSSTPTTVDRIPYMAPGLVGAEKAARGKLPTDTWWHTIVSPTGKEKLGYPTQKPLGVVAPHRARVVPPGGWCSTSSPEAAPLGEAALREGRRFILADQSAEALAVMRRRFEGREGIVFEEAASPGLTDGVTDVP